MARQRHRASFITGAVLGGLTGAAITLWRAPQAGRETRAQIGAMITSHAGPLAEPLAALAEKLNQTGERIMGKAMGAAHSTSAPPPDPSERPGPASSADSRTDGASVPVTTTAPVDSPATDMTATTPTVASTANAPTTPISAPPTPPRHMPAGMGYRGPRTATRGGTSVNAPAARPAPVVATEPIYSVDPVPLTESQREALDLDPVITPEELEQRTSGGQSAAEIQAQLAEKRRVSQR